MKLRCSCIEKEALTIVKFLLGPKFKLTTGQKPPEFIFFPSKEIAKTVSAKFCRWVFSSIDFECNVVDHENLKIPHACAVSRLGCQIIEAMSLKPQSLQ